MKSSKSKAERKANAERRKASKAKAKAKAEVELQRLRRIKETDAAVVELQRCYPSLADIGHRIQSSPAMAAAAASVLHGYCLVCGAQMPDYSLARLMQPGFKRAPGWRGCIDTEDAMLRWWECPECDSTRGARRQAEK